MQSSPSTSYDFKIAQSDDLPVVMEILGEAAAWLAEKGIDQWPSPPNVHWRRRMAEAVERGEVYTVGFGEKHLGIFRLTWSDPYWNDDGLAGYIHSIAIRTEMHGQNLAGAILRMVEAEVSQRAKPFLRLDCLASNSRLGRYYEEHGFIFQGELTDREYKAYLYEKAL